MKKLTAYIVGFVLSVVFTILPVLFLWRHEAGGHKFPSHEVMYGMFVVFAIMQLFVQLYFFLHLGEEEKPRFNLMALCFALLIVAILVGGTLWIMSNLSHEGHESLPFINGSITPAGSND